MWVNRLIGLCGALALGACAQTSTLRSPADGANVEVGGANQVLSMTVAPKLTAEQTLRRLLALIRQSERVTDFTVERLNRAFGVTFRKNETDLGFGERVAPEWWLTIQMLPSLPYGPRLDVSFHPAAPGTHPAATAICEFDYDGFAAGLTTMGFTHSTYRAEHNRVIHEEFQRPGMTLKVYTQGEADQPAEKIRHACVRMVLVS